MRETTCISIDYAAESGDLALLAAACLAHPGSILIPGFAADALHDIACHSTSIASAKERRLLQLTTDLLRNVELTVGWAGGDA